MTVKLKGCMVLAITMKKNYKECLHCGVRCVECQKNLCFTCPQYVFNGDARDCGKLLEQVSKVHSTPTVCRLGNRPVAGWVAVTVSGMVSIGFFPHILIASFYICKCS